MMQRERDNSSFEDQQRIAEMTQHPKIKPAQIDQILQQLYLEHEVKVYDLYYRDQGSDCPLYVKCNKLQDQYTTWVGYCQECGLDHETKYFKVVEKHNQVYVPLSKQGDYKVIDCDQFTRKLSENTCRDLNVFIRQIENEKYEPEIQAYQQCVDQKLDHFNQLFDNIYLQCCGEEIYKRFISKHDNQSKVLKSLCPLTNKLYPWYGYCSHCKENPPHQFYVSFSGSRQPEPLPAPVKLRMINYQAIKGGMLSDLKEKLWNLIQWKFYLSTVASQFKRQGIQTHITTKEKMIADMKEQIDRLQETLEAQKEETQHFQQLYEKEQSNKQVIETKRADLVFKPDLQTDTFYDIEINCESILKLTAGQGWEIKIRSDEFEEKKKNNTVVVSFYGLYNKGKTFLASKLSGKKLPLGYSVSTVGLSALYPQDLKTENAIVFLDTAGTETPICYQQKDEIVDQHIEELSKKLEEQEQKLHERKRNVYEIKLKDRLLTEHLLQRFILSESNIIMIVVDQLTKEEQRLVQKIKNSYEQSEIIIVHNLSKLVSLEDVEKYIQIDIRESFEVNVQNRIFEEINLQGICYVEKRYDTQGQILPDITHVVMAHENSDAGKRFNNFCYHYLKNRILAVTRAKEFDIVQKLIAMIKNHLPEIIELPAEKFNQLSVDVTQSQLTVKYKDGKIVANLNSSSLKSISFDLLGDLKVFKGGLDPKYSIVITDTELILEVELAGQFIPTERDLKQSEKKIISCVETGNRMFEWHGFRKDAADRMQYIVLRGVKKEIQVNQAETVLTNGREKGEFRLIIPINPGICVLRDGAPKFTVINGVAALNYVLQKSNDQNDDFF